MKKPRGKKKRQKITMLSKVKKVVVSFVYGKRVPMKIERKEKEKNKERTLMIDEFPETKI